MNENNIETKANLSMSDYLEVMKKMKEIEKELKEKNPEEFKKIKELKKKEAKIKPEKPEEYKSLVSKFQVFVKSNINEIEKIFLGSITTEKPEGQKWVIFNLGENEKYSLGIINNSIGKKK